MAEFIALPAGCCCLFRSILTECIEKKIEEMMTEQKTEREQIRKGAEKNIQKLEDQLNDANLKIESLLQEKVRNICWAFCIKYVMDNYNFAKKRCQIEYAVDVSKSDQQ